MNRPLTTAATVLALLIAATGTAHARGTYQEGVLSYSVSGSWATSFSQRDRCDVATAPGETEQRSFTSTTTERGTFSSGKATAHYQGKVGSQPFFVGNGDRPAKLSVNVTRTISRPVTCVDLDPEDCGTRTVRGAVSGDFEGYGRRLDLHVKFADRPGDFDLSDPFKRCGDEGSLFLSSVNETRDFDYQGRAVRYPSRSGFWSHKRQTIAGTSTAKGAWLSLKLKTSRRTTLSKRDLHP